MTNNDLRNKKERQRIPFSTILFGLLLCDLFQSKNWAAEELPAFPDDLLLHGSETTPFPNKSQNLAENEVMKRVTSSPVIFL